MVPVVLVAALLGLADAAPAVFGAAEQEGFAAFVAAALAGPGSGTALGAYHAVHAASLRALSLPQAEARARLCASLAGGLAGDDGIESVAAVRPAPPPSVLAARRLTSAAARTCQALATLKRLQCPELADAALASGADAAVVRAPAHRPPPPRAPSARVARSKPARDQSQRFVQASGFSSSAPRDVCGAVLASVSLPDGGAAHAEGINGAVLQVGTTHAQAATAATY